MRRKIPTLTALRTFEVAGVTGNFTRAAELLSVTQSAVSRQVRLLEEQLDETLLVRRHHHLELTDAGQALLHALQGAFDRIERTTRSIRQKGMAEKMRINVPPTFAARWLLPRLSRLRDRCPTLEIALTTHTNDRLTESSTLDGAIRFGNGEWSGVQASLLMKEQHVAVASPALIARYGDLARAIVQMPKLHVLTEEGTNYLTWNHWLAVAGVTGAVTEGWAFDRLDLAIRGAVQGLGAAMADVHMVADELDSGRLVRLGNAAVDGHQSYWLVWREDSQMAQAWHDFVAWINDELAPYATFPGGDRARDCTAEA